MLQLLAENLAQITDHIRTLGWIPKHVSLANPRPAGEGNMNRTLRFDCVSPGPNSPNSIILKQAVPFVAKYPDIPAPIERGAAERAFYQCAENHPQLASRLPRLIGSDKANHLLAFEDLGEAADLSHAYRDRSAAAALPQLLQPLLEWLSHLHSITPPALANHCMRELNHTHIFDLPLQADNGLKLGELTDLAAEFASDRPLVAQAAHLGNIYTGKQSHASTPVLLHGDFYPGSWLGEPEHPADVNVIDPEFAFVGPAEFDIGVCLAHLQFAGHSLDAARECFAHYTPTAGFDASLAEGFAGIELIRRLLGVAQLPLSPEPDLAQKERWLTTGRALVLASAG